MIPAILIILTIHIIIAIRWMLIKILSAVINHRKEFAFVAAGSLAALYHKRTCFSIQCCIMVEKFSILCYNMTQLQNCRQQ